MKENNKPDLEVDHTYNTHEPERVVTRATQLAMELSKEKRRLTEELAALQEEYNTFAPSTPTGTVDWYIKWIGVLSVVVGIFLQNAGFYPWGQVCYLAGAVAWTIVGIIWNDRAVMLGSVIPATATALGLVQTLIGG